MNPTKCFIPYLTAGVMVIASVIALVATVMYKKSDSVSMLEKDKKDVKKMLEK